MNRPLSGVILSDLSQTKLFRNLLAPHSVCLTAAIIGMSASMWHSLAAPLILSVSFWALSVIMNDAGALTCVMFTSSLEAAPYVLVSNAPHSIRHFAWAALISMPHSTSFFVLIINFPIGIFSFTFRSFTVAAPLIASSRGVSDQHSCRPLARSAGLLAQR